MSDVPNPTMPGESEVAADLTSTYRRPGPNPAAKLQYPPRESGRVPHDAAPEDLAGEAP